MAEKITKTPEAIEAEKKEIEELRADIVRRCSKVPAHVINGFYDHAVWWKEMATSAYRLAQSKAPTLAKLRRLQSSGTRAMH
ncbi:hypothetical protein [Paraburkholderia kururiensis]|uniref:hypothetical protein n=1 Tax=Paraburkholderia kururiensis TaxID=984307 RepID=UPI00034A12CA|nr:hypothetical protein [Paraburkholderia kururiensis]